MQHVTAQWNKWLPRLMMVTCLTLFLFHLSVIWTYAVDVPYYDEWGLLDPDQLPAGFSLKGLCAQMNENRVVTSKLLIWALFYLNGWNLIIHQVINFILYGLLLLLLVQFARKTVPHLASWIIVSFILFLLSPLNHENHFMGLQAQIHLGLFFFLASVYLLFSQAFSETQAWNCLLLGSAMAGLSIYSTSGGAVACLVLIFMFGWFKSTRISQAIKPSYRSREIWQWITVSVAVVSALSLWFIGYQKPAGHPALSLPHTAKFWNYFFNVMSVGFGFESLSIIPGMVCLVLVFCPLLWPLMVKDKRKNLQLRSMWAIAAAMLGILAILASIAMGRANGWDLEQSKSSRYSEFGMMLIPLASMAWGLSLADQPKLRAYFFSGLWFFCFVAFWNDWSYFSFYRDNFLIRTASCECIRRYYKRQGRGFCRGVAPFPIASQLEAAKKLNLSFYRRLQNNVSGS